MSEPVDPANSPNRSFSSRHWQFLLLRFSAMVARLQSHHKLFASHFEIPKRPLRFKILLQMDNWENKNKYVYGFLSWLVEKKIFAEVSIESDRLQFHLVYITADWIGVLNGWTHSWRYWSVLLAAYLQKHSAIMLEGMHDHVNAIKKTTCAINFQYRHGRVSKHQINMFLKCLLLRLWCHKWSLEGNKIHTTTHFLV